MPFHTLRQGGHTMKHIMFIILAAATVMGLVLASGYFQP